MLTTFPVANRRWTIDCFPMDVYFTRQRTWGPAGALLAGLLVTGLLVGYLVLLTGRTARVERTGGRADAANSAKANSDSAAWSTTPATSFFLRDLQGRIRDVNKWACDSLGYTREELLSMTIADIDVDFVPKNLGRFALRPAEEYPREFRGRSSPEGRHDVPRGGSVDPLGSRRRANDGFAWCATSAGENRTKRPCGTSSGCSATRSICTSAIASSWPSRSTTAWPSN